MQAAHFILYVKDQEASTSFYRQLLRREPVLCVPGMTEFELTEGCKLGLMPNAGIAKTISGTGTTTFASHSKAGDGPQHPHCPVTKLPHPETGHGIPRCELYLHVRDADLEQQHALACGGRLISAVEDRDWGHRVCYVADADGHVVALASVGHYREDP